MQRFDSTSIPCQYWYDDKWYDLTSVSAEAGFYTTTPAGGTTPWAAFNFCRKINQDTAGLEALS